jgi:hypothetical protein
MPNTYFFHSSTALVGLENLILEVSTPHSFRHTTFGGTPLDERLARRRDLYLTTYNSRKRQISMTPAGFQPATLASELPQTHASELTATGIGRRNTLGSAKIRQ